MSDYTRCCSCGGDADMDSVVCLACELKNDRKQADTVADLRRQLAIAKRHKELVVEDNTYHIKERDDLKQKLAEAQESARIHFAMRQAQQARIEELEAALLAYDPPLPPPLEGETDDQYTDRLTGADGGAPPFAEHRFRQCSIGFHGECSDPEGHECKCPCHQFERLRSAALDQPEKEAPDAE